MRLTFLGTAAAEGIPGLWCPCEYCRKAAVAGGKEIRHRTGYMLDDDTAIDFGPDFFSQSLTYGIDLLKIDRVLFTHAHEDHMNAREFGYRTPGFCKVAKNIDIVGSPVVHSRMVRTLGAEYADLYLNKICTRHGEWVTSGNVEVMGIPADHAPGLDPLILLIRRNGKTLLLAHDTGMLTEKAWNMLKGIERDGLVLESTGALEYPDMDANHLGINGTVRFRDRLQELGCLKENTVVYVTHFSHNAHAMHDELCAAFEPHGIKVAYDGLNMEF